MRSKRVFWVLMAAAALMTGAGLALGQAGQVLVRAANICLECVGIG